MESKKTATCIRIILIGFALMGAGLTALLFTGEANTVLRAFKPVPPFEQTYYYWAAFICIALVPCFAVLVLGWLITNQIERDDTFSIVNSRLLKAVGIISAVDSVFFLCGTIYFFTLEISGSYFIFQLIAGFIGASFSLVAFVLSKLTVRAADIQDENALTI